MVNNGTQAPTAGAAAFNPQATGSTPVSLATSDVGVDPSSGTPTILTHHVPVPGAYNYVSGTPAPYTSGVTRAYSQHHTYKSLRDDLLYDGLDSKIKVKEECVKRLVKVMIVDPDENVNAKDSLLYNGELEFTDETDQELLAGIPVKELLEKHNEKRVNTLDKKRTAVSTERVTLEAIRMRDLRMHVVVFASF